MQYKIRNRCRVSVFVCAVCAKIPFYLVLYTQTKLIGGGVGGGWGGGWWGGVGWRGGTTRAASSGCARPASKLHTMIPGETCHIHAGVNCVPKHISS